MSETIFTPQVIQTELYRAIVTFALEIDRCVCCGHLTMALIKHSSYFPFPAYWLNNQAAQMKAADIRPLGGHTYAPKDGPICNVCAAEGRGVFRCALCGEVRPVAQEKERFGEDPEFLCTICYETVPAKIWEEKSDKLSEAHRYDWD